MYVYIYIWAWLKSSFRLFRDIAWKNPNELFGQRYIYMCVYIYVCVYIYIYIYFFFFQAEDGIRDRDVTGVQTCALPILYSLFTLLYSRN